MKRVGKWSCILIFGITFCLACSQPNNKTERVPTNTSGESIRVSTLADTTTLSEQTKQAEVLWKDSPAIAKKLLLQIAVNSAYLNHYEGAISALGTIGKGYRLRGDYDSSILYYKRALIYAQKADPRSGLESMCYSSIGMVYYRQSIFDSASAYMYKAMEELEKQEIGNYKRAFYIYNNISSFWLIMGDKKNAIPYLNKAEQLAIEHNDSSMLMNVFNSKAGMYDESGETDSAYKYNMIVLHHPSSSIKIKTLTNLNLGRIYLNKRNDPNAAIVYLKQALVLNEDEKDQQYAITIYSLLGSAYAKTGDQEMAEKLLQDVIRKAAHVGLAEEIVPVYKILAGILEKNGKPQEAYRQINYAMQLQDSVYGMKKLELMHKLDVRFQTAEKDKRLALNQLQIARQQNSIQHQYLWFIGFGTIALFLILLLFYRLRVKKQKDEIEKLKATMAGEEQERGRLARELHDGIVSRLSAVRMNFSTITIPPVETGTAYNDFQEAISQLDQSIAELRTTSHNLLPEILQQAGLVEAIRIYCSKITKVTGVNINFQFVGALPSSLEPHFELGIYRILQELINNIIKHSGATEVLVQLHAISGNLDITIDDNGIGTPLAQWETTKGIGLQNIQDRLKALNGSIEIEIRDGTSVYLNFNL